MARYSTDHAMQQQLDRLSHEISHIGRAVGRFSAHRGHDASELGDQLWHQGEIVARQLGKQATKAGKAVREDPIPAIVAVAGFALLLNLVLGRR